ncbi:MAG TPA: histidine phosphatase family protein [Povalibacter sp.]|nr:histidine phosphatase family protein [Povalibacter sp.]
MHLSLVRMANSSTTSDPPQGVSASILPYVCLVRHGETIRTITRQHTGRTDIPLTIRGEDQANALRARLRDMRFSDVFTSPLQRARRTCELAGFGAIAAADANLVEWDYGEYEGQRTSEIRAGRPTWHLFDDGAPKGEAVADIAARADRVISRVRHCAGNVLLFGHQDIFRVIAARWLGLVAGEGRRLYLDTGSLSIIGYDHALDEPVIRLWNVGSR